MNCFGEYRDQTIHYLVQTPSKGVDTPVFMAGLRTRAGIAANQLPAVITDKGVPLSDNELEDQFFVFQINPTTDGPTILETSQVEPMTHGSLKKPDACAVIRLASFHVGADEGIDRNTRATLRMNLGGDSSSDSPLGTVFWSIAAGMNLYNDISKKSNKPIDLKTDFNEAFSNRPVEIPGALGNLSFEVVKHREPKWWQQIFSFLQSGTGKALTSAVGFPAITGQAIGFLDELLNRLDKSDPQVLFKSRQMTLALTTRARDLYNANGQNIKVGVINPGFCLLARGRDYKTLLDNDPEYMASYGLLKPKDMELDDFLKSPSSNLLSKMTYAVLRVGTIETKLNPLMNFGG